ncbi:MAG: lysophospholipid acyltransferase family protein [Gammaproteobacteria bacterium]|nr:lysophospholipid acyltransferase family protein [Gammaproteobacteria bacterium]
MKIWLIRLFLKLTSLLPFSIIRAFGGIIGWLKYQLNSRDVKVTRRNISICFHEFSNINQENLVKQSTIESMKCAMESFWVWGVSADKVLTKFIKIKGLEHILSLREKKTPILMTGAHLGNWEALLNWIASQMPCTIAYKEPKISGMDLIIKSAREKAGVTMVPGTRIGIKQMINVLEENGTFIILSDQRPGKKGGVFAPFFNTQAYTMTLVQFLAQKTSAQLLFFYAKRIKNGFEVIIEPASFDINQPDSEKFASLLNRQLETQIMQCPEQFEWSYRRFRPQPDETITLYSDLK